MTRMPLAAHGPRALDRGFSLITILLMMVVLAALALAAMNTSILQERMAGNARDRNIALQSAEAALRDAEDDIRKNLGAGSAFAASCGNGLCVPPSMAASGPTSTPAWQLVKWTPAQTRRYGQYTGAVALPEVASQPLYIIERLPSLPPAAGESVSVGSGVGEATEAYRITARAVGMRESTVVMLQSIYVK